MSEAPHPDGNEFPSQHFGFNKFEWFFDQYKHYGLRTIPFYFTSNLRREDVEILVDQIRTAEVVILGGGVSPLGMKRFRWIGRKFYNDVDLIRNLLHERQMNGLYTVGFSAGADQLGEYLFSSAYHHMENPFGFGLAKKIMVTLHHEPSRSENLLHVAFHFDDCLVFGLPNDSALAVSQVWLDSGKLAQIIHFILDKTWDQPRDQLHIKTRHGARIDHHYCDGRHWSFNHDDLLVRVIDMHSGAQEAWMVLGGHYIDYWTQEMTGYSSIEEILTTH